MHYDRRARHTTHTSRGDTGPLLLIATCASGGRCINATSQTRNRQALSVNNRMHRSFGLSKRCIERPYRTSLLPSKNHPHSCICTQLAHLPTNPLGQQMPLCATRAPRTPKKRPRLDDPQNIASTTSTTHTPKKNGATTAVRDRQT